jgi:glyoxylase-like metal-dependent hydrolase (beta-lactamase superfamily II)
LLFDPLAVPDEILELAGERETAIVLTSPWHRRDAVELAERLGAQIYVPPPDQPDPDPVPGEVFRAADQLPIGVEAFPGREQPNDLVLWIESHKALVTGDTLVDRGQGLEFLPEWAPEGVAPEAILDALQPLRELPVELVLPTHGPPADREALERALAG